MSDKHPDGDPPMSLRKTDHLTREPGDAAERLIDITQPGQAHLAGTGPLGRTCGECAHYGYRRGPKAAMAKACFKFYLMTQQHGPQFPRHTHACKYFMERANK